jgi:hypothetical protein
MVNVWFNAASTAAIKWLATAPSVGAGIIAPAEAYAEASTEI